MSNQSGPAGGAWFAIIDCAQDERLLSLVQACRDKMCLLVGDVALPLQAASPWLVRLEKTDPLIGIWEQHGKGLHWGIMCLADLSIRELHRHFRRFLQAKLPDGTIALFRFYDPRVFNTFIRAAQPTERAPWFNGVRQYAVEGRDGVTHQYWINGPQLLDGSTPIG